MYYATGLPGWMRFGYSPGWIGRSASGLGPCAEYMMTGRWPNAAMAAAFGGAMGTAGVATKEQRLEFLQSQLDMLGQQIAAVREQIADIEGSQ